MSHDPFKGANHTRFKSGDMLLHPRLGEVKFYREDWLRQRCEVINAYGMIRYIPNREIDQCQLKSSNES